MICVQCGQAVPTAFFCTQCGAFQRPTTAKYAPYASGFFIGGGLLLLSLMLLGTAHPNRWMNLVLSLGGINSLLIGAQFLVLPRHPRLAVALLYSTGLTFLLWIYTIVRFFAG